LRARIDKIESENESYLIEKKKMMEKIKDLNWNHDQEINALNNKIKKMREEIERQKMEMDRENENLKEEMNE
jgi:HAMP domain-containing protein